VRSAGSVEGDARLRLFLALQLPDDAVRTLVDWQARELHGRIVPPENLHVTLAFLGARPAAELSSILGVLERCARESRVPVLEVGGYRETRSVGMLTLRDETGAAIDLAGRLHEALEELGVYRREKRPWLPHLTVLRFRERPRLRPAPPDLGPMVTSDAAVYLSRLHPSGARYEVLESYGLGG
jgi:RNA 2',3'-cyclic 3'-phosphodiesterase